jgi:Ca2+-binding RTX toxin-like protein
MAINRTTNLTNGNDFWDALGHPPLDANDTVNAKGGNDTVFGWDGNDKLFGGTGNDSLFGENGLDQLRGDAGKDTLSGGADYDILRGGAGNDTLNGGDGGDDLYGGTGKDKLTGDTGDDFFFFGKTDSGDKFENKADTILDFNVGEGDAIFLKGAFTFAGNTSGPGEGQYSVWQSSSDHVVTWNNPTDSGFHDVIVKGDDPTGHVFFF